MSGFVHRMMPPTDYNCGAIPEECYNPELTRREIRDKLREVYLHPEKIQNLINVSEYKDHPYAELQANNQLEILVNIDANAIWAHNQQVS